MHAHVYYFNNLPTVMKVQLATATIQFLDFLIDVRLSLLSHWIFSLLLNFRVLHLHCRVRPRVHVSDPTPSHGSKHAPKLPHHHPLPPSLVHTSPSSKPRRERERGGEVKEGMKTKKGMGLTKRREEEVPRDRAMERDRGTREDTHRFPDVLTLPPLVSSSLTAFNISFPSKYMYV